MFSSKQSKSNFGLETGLTHLETGLTYLETGLTYLETNPTYLETHEAMGNPLAKFQGNQRFFGSQETNTAGKLWKVDLWNKHHQEKKQHSNHDGIV